MVKMKKRLLAGAAICCLAAAAMFPLSPFNSRAAEGLVTWQPAANKGDKKSVKMILQLDEDEIFVRSCIRGCIGAGGARGAGPADGSE